MAKNKIIPLVAGVAVIAAFGAGWLILKNTSDSGDSVQTVTIDSLDGTISKISYTLADDDDVTLVYKDDEWQWDGDAEFPLRQTYPETMVQMGQAPAATALVTETPESLGEYGLETPSQTITLTNDAGESKTYYLGDVNSHTGAYYLREDKSNTVYTVTTSFATAFSYPLYGMIITETWPVVSASSINEVTLMRPDGTKLSVQATHAEAESTSEDASSTAAETVTTYKVSNGSGYVTANSDSAASWVNSLATMAFSSCTDYKASDATLKTLGLDADSASILSVKYTSGNEEKTFALLIGHGSGDGVYFTKQPTSTAINTVVGDTLTTFLGTTYKALTA